MQNFKDKKADIELVYKTANNLNLPMQIYLPDNDNIFFWKNQPIYVCAEKICIKICLHRFFTDAGNVIAIYYGRI